MSTDGAVGGLERRYRRLLAWYPRDHRAEHADEMLGVLLASAREGQIQPGIRESANLVAGAIRIRVRRAAGCFGDPRWRDALAVVSVLAPVLVLAYSMQAVIQQYVRGPLVQPGTGAILDQGGVILLAGWLVVVALVLLRQRRASAVGAAAVVAAQVLRFAVHASVGWWSAGAPYAPVDMFLGVLAVAVILGSDGPRRGLEILGRLRSALILGGLLALAAGEALWFAGSSPGVGVMAKFALIAVVVPVAVVAMSMRSPVGRRVIVLTVPAASPLGVFFLARILAGPSTTQGPGGLMWPVYLVLALVVAAFAVTARRISGGSGPVAASSGA